MVMLIFSFVALACSIVALTCSIAGIVRKNVYMQITGQSIGLAVLFVVLLQLALHC